MTVIDLSTHRPVRRFASTAARCSRWALSPDGRLLAAAGLSGRVHVVHRVTGERLPTPPELPHEVYSLGFAPGGDRLLAGEADGVVRVWEVATGKERTCLHGHHAAVYQAGFSRDGRRLLSAGLDGQVLVRDADSGAVQHSHRLPGKALCAAIAVDGRHVGAGTGAAGCFLLELPRRAR
ncbi:MAG: hypothetical protein U0736_05955 [Gemmataceae bacterium]